MSDTADQQPQPLDPPFGEHPADAITEAESQQEARDHVFEFNPERCPYTWTPAMGTSLDWSFASVRCTQRVDDSHGGNHRWNADQQERWSLETIHSFVDALDDAPALLQPRETADPLPAPDEEAIAAFAAAMDPEPARAPEAAFSDQEVQIQLEDAISNIDEPGSDAPYWEDRATTLAQELGRRLAEARAAQA